MDHTDMILKYKRFLKRANYSKETIKNYIHVVSGFSNWLDIPATDVTSDTIFEYLGFLHNRRLSPKTINTYLNGIYRFYKYLQHEERYHIINPVKSSFHQIEPKPLPRFLAERDIDFYLNYIKNKRDIAMFKLMLRCGLRVKEVANLTKKSIEYSKHRIIIYSGKWDKDRVVYISNDAEIALKEYLKSRSQYRSQRVFVVQKGVYKGHPISIRGIQKRMEYYTTKTGVKVCCHRLRHTMATQLLNADAMLSTVQELMGHECIISTQRYAKVSNPKVRRDYFKAMELVMARVKE
ncbi:MAG: tyrosine-type recombinase/integrase [Nitrospinales bacterium]